MRHKLIYARKSMPRTVQVTSPFPSWTSQVGTLNSFEIIEPQPTTSAIDASDLLSGLSFLSEILSLNICLNRGTRWESLNPFGIGNIGQPRWVILQNVSNKSRNNWSDLVIKSVLCSGKISDRSYVPRSVAADIKW